MSAMKKSTTKKTPAPAPAKKTAVAAKPAKAATKKAAVKVIATRPVTTTIAAKIDIGFGNALYIRGEGPGLSWDRGVRMDCVTNDEWQLSLPESARPVTFKLLIND